jgi:cobaltochelatase CobT
MTPPAAASRIVDLWRPLIENRAGRDLDRLERLIENQARFGDVVHDLLDALDMGEDRSSEADEDEADQGSEERAARSGKRTCPARMGRAPSPRTPSPRSRRPRSPART